MITTSPPAGRPARPTGPGDGNRRERTAPGHPGQADRERGDDGLPPHQVTAQEIATTTHARLLATALRNGRRKERDLSLLVTYDDTRSTGVKTFGGCGGGV